LFYGVLLCSVLSFGWKTAKPADGGLLFIGVLCWTVGYLAFGFWDILKLIIATSFFPFWMFDGVIIGEYSRTQSL
jgi:hypothetical protein